MADLGHATKMVFSWYNNNRLAKQDPGSFTARDRPEVFDTLPKYQEASE